MNWVSAVEALRRERRAGVLVTLVTVRGHAPREAGAKMVVSADATWDSIGGGNLEATAVARARRLLDAEGIALPELMSLSLNDKAPVEHGVQCCGGEVTVLLEPLPVVPAVAVFGVGHVGLELARILARHDLELHLVDSRADALARSRLLVLDDAVAHVHVHHSPVPEVALGQVPAGTHVLVMTHDHAEDAAICDAALRCAHLGSIGLIGSSAKWARFEALLRREGHDEAAVRRIQSPIGQRGPTGKEPATIALSVAAELLAQFEFASPSGGSTVST
jgi:xanthine dehydrogenase accessory factor